MSAFEEWKVGTKKFPINRQGDLNIAIKQFRKAKNTDANFARAYGWLAYAIVTGHIDDWNFPRPPERDMTPAQRLAMAVQLAEDAVRIDPGDYDNHWARAFVRLHTGDAAGAKTDFDNARKLNHGNRELLVENADERVYAGDPDKAIEFITRAWGIPDWQRWVLAWAYYFKAKNDPCFYNFALEELKKLGETPGEGKSPAEIFILYAAIYGQKSCLPKNPNAVDDRIKAEKYRKKFEAKRHKRRLKEIMGTNPFDDPTDTKHWRDGLKAAGFSNTVA